MDLNDGYFDDPDLDDEAESHLSMMSTVLVGFLETDNVIIATEWCKFPSAFTIHDLFMFLRFSGVHLSKLYVPGFRFFHIPVFKIRSRKVVDERRTLPPRPLIPSVTTNMAANAPPVVEVVGNVLSLLPTLSVAPIPVATISECFTSSPNIKYGAHSDSHCFSGYGSWRRFTFSP
ncbi:hypothetical protein Adt_03210 [Abeliophyllum distichum]|uniref:Uncharacterized protein n=1 Tax=Abeliophyllum distichum TaxID=126358 RepID=A0ABD1VXV0_9LAMI